MPHLSPSCSSALRRFSYWLANGTVGHPLLEGVYYACIFREPSALEQVYAIYANVVEIDASGRGTNAKHAERRAVQHILQYVPVGGLSRLSRIGKLSFASGWRA